MLVKICGITNLNDALVAADAGATALGFNFFARSPRCITIVTAAEISAKLPSAILKVGVFVEQSPEEVKSVLNDAGLNLAQYYPDTALPGVRYWRVRHVDDGFDARSLNDPEAEAFLLDTPSLELHGGSGEIFDWRKARGAQVRIVLAGGLDGSNVQRAIEHTQPWGVDACSKLESEPGRKDALKVKQFIQAALNA